MNEIDRRIDTALKGAVRQRNYRRIRDRALARLSRLHPNDYAELLEEERARDEAESKKWLDITGRTISASSSDGTPNERSEVSKHYTYGDSEKASNLGGEG